MIAKPAQLAVLLMLGCAVAGGSSSWAQESGKTKDDALDSLIEKLTGSDVGASKSAEQNAKPTKPAEKPKTKAGRVSDGSKDAPSAKPALKPGAGQPSKPSAPKASGSDIVAPKDQAIDDLLEKLGETTEKPAPEERPRGGPAGEPKDQSRPQQPDRSKLTDKDKALDDKLEEYAGRKKRRPAADEAQTGAVGEIIKEMRDVEQRLGKPDPSEDTQNKQKQIVRNIDTLIEQVRKSGSSGMRLVLKRVRRPGQGGNQPPDQQGAMARGAPLTKPAKPTGRHSTANGKDIWGHLPPELQQAMEASFKEVELGSKMEMISRYFLSVNKGKLVREE